MNTPSQTSAALPSTAPGGRAARAGGRSPVRSPAALLPVPVHPVPAREERPLAWQDRGACKDVDPDLFFGADGEPAEAREFREARARRVCAGCPVRRECLAYAAANPDLTRFGMWGGLSEDEWQAARGRKAS